MFEIRKIVVPTDFSDNSLQGLRQANEIARRFDAEIVLLHVVEPPVYPAMTFGAAAASLPVLHEELEANARAQLERWLTEHVAEGIEATSVLRSGSSYAEIIDVAKEEKADLIVMATHGHTGVKHFFLGSTAEKVVRKAVCPVLTVRSSVEVEEG